jgi:hypothetical protein
MLSGKHYTYLIVDQVSLAFDHRKNKGVWNYYWTERGREKEQAS